MGWYSCSQRTLASCETIQDMERRDLEHVINLYTNNHFVQENFQSPAYSWKEKIMWIPNFNRLSLRLFFLKKKKGVHNYLSVNSIGAGGNIGSHSTGRAGTLLWGLGSTHQCWVSDYHWRLVSSNIRYTQEQMLYELQADRKAKKTFSKHT